MIFDSTPPSIPSNSENTNDLRIAPQGFREYDARWLFPEEISLNGIRLFGDALGAFFKKRHQDGDTLPAVIVGHDWRSYSADVKNALIDGLIAAGCRVIDIGLTLSPIAYFAQQALGVSCLAMVTASHNENGWTGIKMSHSPPTTLLPEEIQEIKQSVSEKKQQHQTSPFSYSSERPSAYYESCDVTEPYADDVTQGVSIQNRFKVVVSCGNGTAGHFVPGILRRLGIEVVEHNCTLDYSFPHHNPNPEDMRMLHALSQCVVECGADLGFAFDGDGDRCGVVDSEGKEIFADKLGVLMARYLAPMAGGVPKFVVDVKSTSLFADDAMLASCGAQTFYWKTGHSYMKQKVLSTGAVAGFEKSGHMIFAPPFGRGYDDGIATAIMTLRLCDAAFPTSLASLYAQLTPTWMSPTMAPFCPDEEKYAVVERIKQKLRHMQEHGTLVLGESIESLLEVNGVRVVLASGAWGLVRASSNKPSLVVVVESRRSREHMVAMFGFLDELLKQEPSVGAYDQALTPEPLCQQM